MQLRRAVSAAVIFKAVSTAKDISFTSIVLESPQISDLYLSNKKKEAKITNWQKCVFNGVSMQSNGINVPIRIILCWGHSSSGGRAGGLSFRRSIN